MLEGEEKEPFSDEVIIPGDLPKTEEERIKRNKEYQERWKARKKEVEIKEREELKRRGKSGNEINSLICYAPGSEGESEPIFGKGIGAGYYDTSLYMAGDIAVGIFFVAGSKGNWMSVDINSVYDEICEALSQFIDDEPNAHIKFTFIKEVDEQGNPKSSPLNEWDYVNDLRNIYNTHWAYKINVFNGYDRANAYYFGPSTRIYKDDLRNGYVVRHETMHIFGAEDQYKDAKRSAVYKKGYLNIINANSEYNDGKGYFNGAGEGQKDIMISDGPIGVYSRGQIGWRDSDGDGTLETLDTFPDTVIGDRIGVNPFTYNGESVDIPLLNPVSYYGSVTINTITGVEYRVKKGSWVSPWCLAEAKDGSYDYGKEEFSFSLSELSSGRYTVEVRALNSVGNKESSYAMDEIEIAGSLVNNVRPYASFSITPEKGSIETLFTFDASESSDFEDGEGVEVRWDFENDGIWDSETKVSKFIRYSDPGVKTIRLEVRDIGGLAHSITKSLLVADSNISPKAFFRVTPENIHQEANPYTFQLDASGCYDGEDELTDLKIRWDFEDDGVWDTEYLNYLDNLTVEHSYNFPDSYSLSGSYNIDCAQDVYVSGNYAYVADGNSGLRVIDISNPKIPILSGSCDTPGSAYGIYVSGNYAYVADGSSGLQVIDISNSRAPIRVGSCDTPGSAYGIYVSGNYAYLADVSSGLQIIDISNPKIPILSGSYDTPSSAYGIYVSGNYAYVADVSLGLQVIDISNPESPIRVGNCDTNSYAQDVYISGNYAYVANGYSGLQIIDISNPKAPTAAGNYDTPGFAQDVYVSGNYAYVADHSLGLQVIDISNPRIPTLVGSCDTPGSAYGVYVSGKYAYVADGSSGLKIIGLVVNTGPSRSSHKRVRLEVIDKNMNISQTTRDIWTNPYNHPPYIADINFFPISIILCELMGSYDYLVSPLGVYVSGDYAYVADGNSGLQVIDISNPKIPILSENCDTPGFARGVYVSGNYAYVADGNSGLQVIDISNPGAPIQVGKYNTPSYAYGVYVLGNYAYVVEGYSGLQVIDISNPKIPILSGSCDTPGPAYGIYVSGNYAYVADNDSGLQVIDISNPKIPILSGSCDTPGSAYGIYVSGNYAYVADNDSGLQVIDISNPGMPTIAGTYDTNFARGVYVSGNYVYLLSFTNTRLEIIKVEKTEGLHLQISESSDPDLSTSWDGLLEYRWDFNSDNSWDTEFSQDNNAVEAPTKDCNLVICEVRDKFDARAVVKVDVTPVCIVNKTNSPQYPYESLIFQAEITDMESGVDEQSVYLEIDSQGHSMYYNSQSGLYEAIISNIPFPPSLPSSIAYKILARNKNGIESCENFLLSLIVDTSKPATPVVTDSGVYSTYTDKIYAEWSSSDSESGIQNYQYSIGTTQGGTNILGWQSIGTQTEGWLKAAFIPEMTYYINVMAQNKAGLWSEPGYSDGIQIRYSFSIPLSVGWSNICLPIEPTDSKIESVLASIAGKYDRVASFTSEQGALLYSPALPAFLNTLKDLHAGQGFSILMKEAVTLTIDGQKTDSIFPVLQENWNFVGLTTLETKNVTDVVNISQIVQIYTMKPGSPDTTSEADKLYYPAHFTVFEPGKGYWIKEDTIAPAGTISINDGAASTTFTSVTLTLSASDTVSGVSEMQLSNDQLNWPTSPQAYITSTNWTLSSGDGTKTVYVKFKDAAGNWSDAISDTIILDTTTKSFSFNLIAGLNLLTLPLEPSPAYTAKTLAAAINAQGGQITKVQKWDGSGWKTYSVGAPFGDFAITVGQGYILSADKASQFILTGKRITNIQYNINIGLNLLGFPIGGPYTAKSLSQEINAQGGKITKVQRWDGSGWKTYTVGAPFGDFAISPSEAVMLYSDSCFLYNK
ncbi:MAG: hypothetical protein V1709_02645 [Planctomycetota bacterium]